MKTLTLKDFTTYRGAVTARVRALLAEARGTRWDRIAGRVAGALGVVAGLGGWIGFIPAKYAAPAAGVCAACGALAPRATRAAGLMAAAYNQKRPLLPVLWEVAQVFANPTTIIAEAKSAAQNAEAEQARQQADQTKQAQAALIEAAVAEAVRSYTGSFGPGQLSKDVPEALKKPLQPVSAPPERTDLETTEPLVAAMPIPASPSPVPVPSEDAESEQTGETL